jgi:hypothetical protein
MKKLLLTVAVGILVSNLNFQKIDCKNKNSEEEWMTILQDLVNGSKSYPDQETSEVISGFSSDEEDDESDLDHADLFTHVVGVVSTFNAIYFTRPHVSLSIPNQAISNLLLKTLNMIKQLRNRPIALQLEADGQMVLEEMFFTQEHIKSVVDVNPRLESSKKCIRAELQSVWPVFREYFKLIGESSTFLTKTPAFISLLNEIKKLADSVEHEFNAILSVDKL